MSTTAAKIRKVKKGGKKVAKAAAPVNAFRPSLEALEEVVKVVVNGETPDINLLQQVDYYLATLQDGADLINVVMYQHSMTKLMQVMQGINTLHEDLLKKENLEKLIKDDKQLAVRLLGTLYKESGATLAFMDNKGSKLFDTDGLKRSQILAQSSKSAEVGKSIGKIPAAKREELRGIITSLLKKHGKNTLPAKGRSNGTDAEVEGAS